MQFTEMNLAAVVGRECTYVSSSSTVMCISSEETDMTNQCFESWLGTCVIVSSRWRKAQLPISVEDGFLEDPGTVHGNCKNHQEIDC